MSDTSQGDGWWIASDGKWYAPEQHPDYVAPPNPVTPVAEIPHHAQETTVMSAADATPGPSFVAPSADSADAQSGGPDTNFLPAAAPPANPDQAMSTGDSPSNKRPLLLGIGALVLVAGLGFLAFRFFSGGSAAIASVNERDAVGLADVFDPDEVEAWFGSFTPALEQIEALEQGSGESANELPDEFQALFDEFDYSITGPDGADIEYDVVPLDDDGRISRVRINALDFELSNESDLAIIAAFGNEAEALDLNIVDGVRLEVRDQGDGVMTRAFVPGDPVIEEFGSAHMDLVTVQKDGKWYISAGYTVLEWAREQGEFDRYDSPDFGRAFALVDSQEGGTSSPEETVQLFFDSIETLDYETMIRITDPYATPYLHDYQPIIDSQVNEQDRRSAVEDAAISVDDIELTVSEWNGRTLVTFEEVRADVDGGSLVLDAASWCATFDGDGQRDRACAEDGLAELVDQLGSDVDPGDLIPDMTGLVVVERNGRWYLDVFGTSGFLLDQVADVAQALNDDAEATATANFAGFFFTPGPIARQGSPATTQATTGTAGVGLDIEGYSQLNNGFSSFTIAVARVATDQSGTFVTGSDLALSGEDWVVVYTDDPGTDTAELPAIGARTDGELDVELFEATVTEMGVDGFSGQLGGQGRPQVFFFSPDVNDLEVQVTGANAELVKRWQSNGVVYNDPSNFAGFASDGDFLVVTGEPNAVFSVMLDDPFSEPEPDPVGERNEAELVADFAALVAAQGFTFDGEQQGGFFDGCGGPNDPDVTSYVYVDELGQELMIVTPYPSFDRSVVAFDQLVNVATPCASFDGIEVNDIVMIDIDNVRIEWQLIDDPSSIVFEHYRLAGPTVVVATSDTVEGLDDQLELMAEW